MKSGKPPCSFLSGPFIAGRNRRETKKKKKTRGQNTANFDFPLLLVPNGARTCRILTSRVSIQSGTAAGLRAFASNQAWPGVSEGEEWVEGSLECPSSSSFVCSSFFFFELSRKKAPVHALTWSDSLSLLCHSRLSRAELSCS